MSAAANVNMSIGIDVTASMNLSASVKYGSCSTHVVILGYCGDTLAKRVSWLPSLSLVYAIHHFVPASYCR